MRGLHGFPILVSVILTVHWLVLVLLFKLLYTFPFVSLTFLASLVYYQGFPLLPYGGLI